MYSIFLLIKYICTFIGYCLGVYLGATVFCNIIGLPMMTNFGTFIIALIWGMITGFIVAFAVNFIFNMFDRQRFGSREWKQRKRDL